MKKLLAAVFVVPLILSAATVSFAANHPPKAGAVTPVKGSSNPGQTVSFTTTCSDQDGYRNILQLIFLVSEAAPQAPAGFNARYDRRLNRLYLRDDDGTAWLGGFAPGSSRVIENSYSRIHCSKTKISIGAGGRRLTVKWAVSFKPAFAGLKKTYLAVSDKSNRDSAFIRKGIWMVKTPGKLTRLPAIVRGQGGQSLISGPGGITPCGDGGYIYVDKANAADPNQDGSITHPYDTIQEGINAAVNGSIVHVASGTYYENITLNKSGVKLQGADKGTVIMDASGVTLPVVTCSNLTGSETAINGFTIAGGYVGIKCGPTTASLKIVNNDITSNNQNGILLESGASATVEYNNIVGCWKGIYGSGNNNVSITGNNIVNNRGSYGGGIILRGASALIEGNSFSSNWDGAINLSAGCNATISGNKITDNASWDQAAGLNITNSTAVIRNNLIKGSRVCHATDIAAGLHAADSKISVFNNIFYLNNSSRGAAIDASTTQFVCRNNIFVENGGGQETVLLAACPVQDFAYNDMFGNTTIVNTTGVTLGQGNITSNPMFADTTNFYFNTGSPCINTGDPASQFNDTNGTRNDMGIHGGPYGDMPAAAFSVDATDGARPLTVRFTDQSAGVITAYLWNFGDGQTSATRNPAHTYNSAGDYTVSLTVTGPGGSNTITKTNFIHVDEPQAAPVARFTGNPVSGSSPLAVQFTDQSTGNVTGYLWNFGDGEASAERNPAHVYNLTGWDTEYNADALPQNAVPAWEKDAPGTTHQEAIEDGKLHIIGEFVEGTINYSRTANFKASSEYVIEARFKQGHEFYFMPYGVMCIEAVDDKYYWRLDFTPDYIAVGSFATHTATYAMDTTSDYHVYRAVARNGIVDVYVDGIKRITADVTWATIMPGQTPEIRFGNHAGGSGPPVGAFHVEGWWDYVKVRDTANPVPPLDVNYTVSLSVNGTGGLDVETKTNYIHVVSLVPDILTTSLPAGEAGMDYEGYLNAVGGTPPYSWSIESGILPAGLGLDSSSGKISGTTAIDGTFGLVIKVTDAALRTDTQAVSLKIVPGAPVRTDEELLDETEAKSALYFYKEALSNGFVKDGDHKNFSSVAATGFGLASLCVMAERYNTTPNWTVSPEQARIRVNQILDNCISYQSKQSAAGNTYGKSGFLYHFITQNGTRQGSSEVSTVDMALFLAGAITAGEYFGKEVQAKAEKIYNKMNWAYFLKTGINQFSHGWTPESGLFDSTWDRPTDESMLVSLLALGSAPNNQLFAKSFYSWPRVTRQYAGYQVVSSYFGSLFTYYFAHCFFDFEFMGNDAPSLSGSTASSVNWWTNSVNAARANRQFCIDQKTNYSSYGPDSWGITSCEYPMGGYGGLLGAAPCEFNEGTPYHDGTIAPSGAISCMPLMRASDSEPLAENLSFKALKHYYTDYYNQLWGPYGPRNSFDQYGRFNAHCLGIDTGPQALMIENYRTGLLWDKFMANRRVVNAAKKIFGKVHDIYVDIANASDAAQDGSREHPFDKIQEGIAAAVSGATVHVAAGTYTDPIVLNKSVTLEGAGTSATTVSNAGINCENIAGHDAHIRGFKIFNSRITCAGTVNSLTIEDNYIDREGIYLKSGASAVIKNNIIDNCRPVDGAGNNNVEFTGNACRNTLGPNLGGIALQGGTALIKDNILSQRWDGAVILYNMTNATVERNILSGGGWNASAGISVLNSTAIIRNNFIGGTVYSSGGVGVGVNASSSTVYLFNNILICTGASSTARGVAIKALNTNLTVKNNIIYRPENGSEAVLFEGSGAQDFSYNDIFENHTGADTVGIIPGPGNISADPLFTAEGWYLAAGSPCINTGDPAAEFNDKDGTPNDMGMHGGPFGDINTTEAPVLDPIGNKELSEGQELSFTLSASDADGNPLTYSVSNLPYGASFDTTTGAFSWTPGPGSSGVYTKVTFTVSDGHFTDSGSITIVVNDPAWPAVTEYTYYDDADKRLESVAFAGPDASDIINYHYINEDCDRNNNGLVEHNEHLGRVDKAIRSAPDADGAIAYGYQYYIPPNLRNETIIGRPDWQPGLYSFANLTIPSGSTITTFGNYLRTHLYVKDVLDIQGAIHVKPNSYHTLYGSLPPGVSLNIAPTGTLNLGSGLGTGAPPGLYIDDPLPASNSNGSITIEGTMTILSQYSLTPASVYSKRCYKYPDSEEEWTVTYTFYGATNFIESKVVPVPDGTYFYYYLNENFNSQGYGRLEKETRPVADADGAMSYRYEYYGNTGNIHYKYCYRGGSQFSDPIVRYEYDMNGNIIGRTQNGATLC